MNRFLPLFVLLAAALPGAEAVHLGKTLEAWRADLASPDRTTRLLAARSIGEMVIAGTTGARETLTDALSNQDSGVRYWAAVALGEMKSGEPGALLAATKDQAPEVRVWAAYALVRQGRASEGMPVLIATLGDEEKGARLQAVTALDQLGAAGREAVSELKKAVTDEFDYVGRIARHALWVLGERPCPYRDCD